MKEKDGGCGISMQLRASLSSGGVRLTWWGPTHSESVRMEKKRGKEEGRKGGRIIGMCFMAKEGSGCYPLQVRQALGVWITQHI